MTYIIFVGIIIFVIVAGIIYLIFHSKKNIKQRKKRQNITTHKDVIPVIDTEAIQEVPTATVLNHSSDNKSESKLMQCESCNKQFSKRIEKCPHCEWVPCDVCQICNHKIPHDSISCPECGDIEPFSNKTQHNQENRIKKEPVKHDHLLNNTSKTISPFGCFVQVWKKYAVFEGRASRREFWWYQLFYFLFIFVVGIIPAILIPNIIAMYPDSETTMMNLSIVWGIVVFLYILAAFLPALAVSIRRLHDTGRSGLWVLLYWAFPLNFITLFFQAQKSDAGDNEYGANPND